MTPAAPLLPIVGCTAVLALAACSGDDGEDDSEVIVSAASSLDAAFTAYAKEAGLDAKQSFAGSDELAAQIRRGVTPDVYAAADTGLPDRLQEEGLVEEPVVFAHNTLVVAVPAGSTIDSIEDLGRAGTKIAVGDPSVPVGGYARAVLGRLPAAQRAGILANVRSEEPDAGGIVGKLMRGAVEAGFVYATDIVATDGELASVQIPAALAPDVRYGAAVVVGAEHPRQARAFIDGLLDGAGADALRAAGFKPPPARE